MNNLELCNGLRKEMEGIDSGIFPLDVFPQAVQKIMLDAMKDDGLNIELLATAMLSAAATAIGNTFTVHIRGNWYTNCALFFILVARPGTGKTPALSFAFAPIRERDGEMARRFMEDLDRYKRSLSSKDKEVTEDKPHIVQTILDDFTPEALYRQHFHNQRGVILLIDEILGLLKSRKRYNGENKLIEDLLSAFSGMPIKNMRKDEESLIIIPHPCINMIGGIQTNLVHELFSEEFTSNGFTDRLVFIAPAIQEIPRWTMTEEQQNNSSCASKWHEIIRKIMDIKCEYADGGEVIVPKVLEMADDARRFYYSWNNEIVDSINGIKDEDLIETHKMKLNGILPRFALILQVLRWATGESHIDFIDMDSICGAKKLLDYFEGKYYQLKKVAVLSETRDVESEWFSSLPDKFETAQAQAEWYRVGLKRRDLFRHLSALCHMEPPMLRKVAHGVYEKCCATPNTSAASSG